MPEQRSAAMRIALGLTRELALALRSGATPAAISEARRAAQVLALPGLDRVLSALSPHAGRRWPREVEPAIGRIQRLAAECESEGDIEPLRRDDRELSALAAEIEATEWSTRATGDSNIEPAVASLLAAEVLADLPIEGSGGLHGVRLTAPVAAALRAALDWLVDDEGPRRPLRVKAEESVLEVTCESAQPVGLRAAHDVLASVGGNLGPLPGPDAGSGTCRVRVPALGERGVYLMLAQGGVPFAVPWHAVLRVHVLAAADLEQRTKQGGAIALLPPIVPAEPVRSDRPVALIAHGLKRGFLIADRLVWRLAAEPCAAPGAPPAPGLERAVRTEEGEVYWLADPALLLAGVPLPILPEPRPSRPLPRVADARPAAVPAPAKQARATTAAPRQPESGSPPPRAPAPRLRVLEARDVEALGREVEPSQPPASPATGPQTLSAVSVPREAPPAAPARRRALVAEDSFTARIFLGRMLEQHGFEVTGVERAADLLVQIERGPWSLVFVDAELPDARGPDLLRSLAKRAVAPLVALVRDRQDLELAVSAGVSRVLRKPFDPDALSALIERLARPRGAR